MGTKIFGLLDKVSRAVNIYRVPAKNSYDGYTGPKKKVYVKVVGSDENDGNFHLSFLDPSGHFISTAKIDWYRRCHNGGYIIHTVTDDLYIIP